jgi:hypothetical protein
MQTFAAECAVLKAISKARFTPKQNPADLPTFIFISKL